MGRHIQTSNPLCVLTTERQMLMTIKKRVAREAFMSAMNAVVTTVREKRFNDAVLGEKIECDGFSIVPVSKVSVGITDRGIGTTRTPLVFLVIRGEEVKVLRVNAGEMEAGEWRSSLVAKARTLLSET